MKKIISILFTIILIISSLDVFAFNDIKNSYVSDAVDTLSSFGIINGYEDGSFRPDNYITRAEFSKIIVTACDYGHNGYEVEQEFRDVNNTNWARDYIYIAKSLGIVNGVDAINFEPESNITYEQAVKMIVAALGYKDEAEQQGGYPSGYSKVALNLGITKNISYKGKDTATRGNIALMIFNALDAQYYDIWNDNGTVKRQLSDMTLYEKHEYINNIKNNGGISSGYENDEADIEVAVG